MTYGDKTKNGKTDGAALERRCKSPQDRNPFLVAERAGITVEEIAEMLHCNIKTISEHARILIQAGLLNKRYRWRSVEHTLSPYGKIFHRFLTSFSYS